MKFSPSKTQSKQYSLCRTRGGRAGAFTRSNTNTTQEQRNLLELQRNNTFMHFCVMNSREPSEKLQRPVIPTTVSGKESLTAASFMCCGSRDKHHRPLSSFMLCPCTFTNTQNCSVHDTRISRDQIINLFHQVLLSVYEGRC